MTLKVYIKNNYKIYNYKYYISKFVEIQLINYESKPEQAPPSDNTQFFYLYINSNFKLLMKIYSEFDISLKFYIYFDFDEINHNHDINIKSHRFVQMLLQHLRAITI